MDHDSDGEGKNSSPGMSCLFLSSRVLTLPLFVLLWLQSAMRQSRTAKPQWPSSRRSTGPCRRPLKTAPQQQPIEVCVALLCCRFAVTECWGGIGGATGGSKHRRRRSKGQISVTAQQLAATGSLPPPPPPQSHSAGSSPHMAPQGAPLRTSPLTGPQSAPMRTSPLVQPLPPPYAGVPGFVTAPCRIRRASPSLSLPLY